MPDLKDRIRQLREEKGLTQKELANEISVSQTAINYWENGKREPDFKTVKKIAEFFDTSPSYLMGWINRKDYSEKLLNARVRITGTQVGVETMVTVGYSLELLNEKGQEKAIELVDMLTKIPEYRKKPTTILNNLLATFPDGIRTIRPGKIKNVKVHSLWI